PVSTKVNANKKHFSYHIVFDSVYRRIIFARIVSIFLPSACCKIMFNSTNFENTQFHKCPSRYFLGELLIGCLHTLRVLPSTVLAQTSLDFCIKPGVLKHLRRPENSESSRVAGLHCGDESKLLTNCKRILDSLRLIFRIVGVCRPWCSQDGY